MPNDIFDDETLLAFADGELDKATAEKISTAIANDPLLASRVAVFRLSRERVAAAMAPLAHEPVPDALARSVAAMIERDRLSRQQSREGVGATVVELDSARQSRRPQMGWFLQAAAAVLAMVTGFGGYYVGRQHAQQPPEFAAISDSAIIQALSEIPSGQSVDMAGSVRTFEPLLSFQLEDGTLCREFRLDTADSSSLLSIACHEQDNWRTHLVMASRQNASGFAPAGSSETIDAYLASIHAGQPLDGAAEDAALKAVSRKPKS